MGTLNARKGEVGAAANSALAGELSAEQREQVGELWQSPSAYCGADASSAASAVPFPSLTTKRNN